MYLFFFGSNDYLIHRQVEKIKNRYRQKSGGDLNLVELDGENILFEDFLRQIQAMPLLATSRLVIVNNIFKNKNKKILEQIKNILPSISSSTVVVFAEKGEVDKRLGLFRALNKPKISREFGSLSWPKLREFIKNKFKEAGSEADDQAVEYLSEVASGNLWRLENEIQKLSAYASGKKVKIQDVEELVQKDISADVFVLTDSLVKGEKARALKTLDNLFASSEPALRILALINYQVRSLAQIKDAFEAEKNSFALAKKTSLAPFQVKKVLPYLKDFSWDSIAGIYQKLVLIDEKIKTGKIEDREGIKELVLEF